MVCRVCDGTARRGLFDILAFTQFIGFQLEGETREVGFLDGHVNALHLFVLVLYFSFFSPGYLLQWPCCA